MQHPIHHRPNHSPIVQQPNDTIHRYDPMNHNQSTNLNTTGNTAGSRKSALIALLLLIPAPSIGTYASMMLDLGTLGQIIYALSKIWIVLLPLIWIFLIDKQPISFSKPKKGGFITATILGIIISILILIIYRFFSSNLIDENMLLKTIRKNQLDIPWRFVGLSIYLITINSLLEEFVWRWFVFRKCETLLPGPLAVLASAALFTLHHIIALRAQMPWTPTILCSLGVFIGGAVWSWCYLRYRSIWPGYVSHAIVDLAILAIAYQMIFNNT